MGRFVSNNGITPIRSSKACTYITPGANSWTVPSGVTCATFELYGGGGGGGAKCCCDCYHQGQSGAPGGYSSLTIPVTPGDVYTICVGTGGGTSFIGGIDTYCHACCFGGAGTDTYVSGNNITTLCAAGGYAGCNMCYLYCMCAAAYSCAFNATTASVATPNTSQVAANAFTSIDGTKLSPSATVYGYGWMGIGSDSQSYYYQTGSTATPFHHAMVTGNHCPCTYNVVEYACSNRSTLGGGGRGAMTVMCCCCNYAGVGRHGAVIIKF